VDTTVDLSGFPAQNQPVFNQGTGEFTWTPRLADVRTAPYVAPFNATDGRGAQATALKLQIRGVATNSPPVIVAIRNELTGAPVGGSLYLAEGARLSLLVDFDDGDGDAVTLSREPSTIGTLGDTDKPKTKRFTWTPGFSAYRTDPYVVTFIAK